MKFNTDHYILGNSYRTVFALRGYPTSTEELALLRHLGDKSGVTLSVYARQVTPAEERNPSCGMWTVKMTRMLPKHFGSTPGSVSTSASSRTSSVPTRISPSGTSTPLS